MTLDTGIEPQDEAAPVANDPNSYEDYWGVDETHTFYLPDGKQFIQFSVMNEGAKSRFQKMTNQDLTIGRDNTAKVRMDPANERHELIKQSVTGWQMFKRSSQTQNMEPVLFSKQSMEKWLDVAPPKLVEELEFAIRKANPWMQADMSVEEIDKELDRLTELRRDVIDRKMGEESSSSK